jgi:uncharacterized membrane protein
MDEATTGSAGQPRSVEAGRGVAWWTEGWALFMKNPGMWVVFGLILLGIFFVMGLVPLIGTLASSLLMPVFVGSCLLAARKLDGGGTIEVNDLFVCFKEKLNPLLVVGALVLVATLVIGVVMGLLGFGAVAGMMAGGRHSMGGVMFAAGMGSLAVLVGLVLGFIVAMALWFAPALIVFRNVAPVDALKASVDASLKNVVPFLLYGLIYIVAAIVATIPFALGWLVLVPVLLLTLYVSYKDVYGA